ncbi:MAG: DNA-directed RNA polymerase subunit H [Candidatus Caldarchaeales archaeon]
MSKTSKKKAARKEETPKFSILEHELVPPHRVLTPEEARKILEKYGIQPQQLPYILASDPVVREIGARPGDIIEIRRKSPTAGEAVYYRLVVVEE